MSILNLFWYENEKFAWKTWYSTEVNPCNCFCYSFCNIPPGKYGIQVGNQQLTVRNLTFNNAATGLSSCLSIWHDTLNTHIDRQMSLASGIGVMISLLKSMQFSCSSRIHVSGSHDQQLRILCWTCKYYQRELTDDRSALIWWPVERQQAIRFAFASVWICK